MTCFVNGRICPLDDNYTSVSTKGKAVVDYIIAAHSCLENCISFKVLTPNQLAQDVGCMDIIGEHCKLPDHSILNLSFYVGCDIPQPEEGKKEMCQESKKKVCRRLPNDFLCSDLRRAALLELLNRLEGCHRAQEELDSWYDDLCTVLYEEMSKHTQDLRHSPKSNKAHRVSKPYWNKELQDLWHEMHCSEKLYLKCKGDRAEKQHLLHIFRNKQHVFDKRYRFFKRKYQRGQILHLEQIQTSNPQAFWNEINKLGPKRAKHIPMEVWGEEGHLVDDGVQVLNKWETEFSGFRVWDEAC